MSHLFTKEASQPRPRSKDKTSQDHVLHGAPVMMTWKATTPATEGICFGSFCPWFLIGQHLAEF